VRTAAISSRFGKRFGSGIARVYSAEHHLEEGAASPRRHDRRPEQQPVTATSWARAPKARLPGLPRRNAQHFDEASAAMR